MGNRLLLSVFVLLMFLVVGDCVSTYYCLTTATDTYQVREGNVVVGWLLQQVGLVEGLTLLAAAKATGLVYLFVAAKVNRAHYLTILVGTLGATLITGYINYSNWSVYYTLLNG